MRKSLDKHKDKVDNAMAELTDAQKLQYFNSILKTLNTIRECSGKPVFGEQVTMKFINYTANDMLITLEKLNGNDTPRDC